MAIHFDKFDAHLLTLLQQDSSLGVKELAKAIGLSLSPTHERIKRLERDGYIEKYVALVNRDKLGKHLLVLCTVTLKEQSVETLKAFEESIICFKEVLEVMCISGNHDYLLKIVVKDVQDYHRFVMEHLSSIANIFNLSSNFVLKTLKNETAFDVQA